MAPLGPHLRRHHRHRVRRRRQSRPIHHHPQHPHRRPLFIGSAGQHVDEAAIYPTALTPTHYALGRTAEACRQSLRPPGTRKLCLPTALRRSGVSPLRPRHDANGCRHGNLAANATPIAGALNGDADEALQSGGSQYALAASGAGLPSVASPRTWEVWNKTTPGRATGRLRSTTV